MLISFNSLFIHPCAAQEKHFYHLLVIFLCPVLKDYTHTQTDRHALVLEMTSEKVVSTPTSLGFRTILEGTLKMWTPYVK